MGDKSSLKFKNKGRFKLLILALACVLFLLVYVLFYRSHFCVCMCAVHIGPASPPFSKDAFFVVGVKIVLSLDPFLVVFVPIFVPLLPFHVVVVVVSPYVIVVIR